MFGQFDPDLPAVEDSPVDGLYSVVCVSLVIVADESESAAFLAKWISGDVDVADIPVLLEHTLEGVLSCSESQIVYLQ